MKVKTRKRRRMVLQVNNSKPRAVRHIDDVMWEIFDAYADATHGRARGKKLLVKFIFG